MKQCWNCNKTIKGKEFVWNGGPEVFCSADCLPEGVLDEEYALDYVGLLENYNDFEHKSWPITDYYERQDLLSEIDYCINQCEEYQLGDLEGSFYKQELRKLYNDFLDLRNRVWSCFMKKENLLRDIGLYIRWEEIINLLSLEAANYIKLLLQNVIREENIGVTIMYSGNLDPENDSRNFVYVTGNEDYMEDDWKHPLIEQLYNVSKMYFESLENIEDGFEDFICYEELAKCPICGYMEIWEDFGYSDKYHMLVCGGCSFG